MTTYTNDIYGVQQQIADEQAAQEQGYITDAVNLASVQGAGMMLNARDIGTRQGDVYANLGRMLTGEAEAVDPRLVRMQKLQAIAEQVPEPDTVDEYIQLANLMNQAGLYGEAQKAMEMANDIRASMPTSTKPKTYADIEGYKLAVEQGYKGDFVQYQLDLKKAGADKTTMMPTPAKGFQYQQDENGNWIATIIPGGSADLEIQAADAKALLAKVNTQKAGNVVLKNVGLVRNAIKNPQTFFGMEVGSTGWGSLLKDIPATQAKGVAGMIATIKGNVGFDKLQAMREASPTGGALGQVSELELKLLMSTIGSLDQAQSDADLLRVLNEIEYWYNHIVHGAAYASTAVEETEEVVDDPLGVL